MVAVAAGAGVLAGARRARKEQPSEMAGESAPYVPPPGEAQLTQARVPLEEAAQAFTQLDASGRTPIVVLPARASRISPQLLLAAVAALAGATGAVVVLGRTDLLLVALLLAAVLLALGVYRSFLVLVPEGTNALLVRRGRYLRTIGPGLHIIPPLIAVSHLVTRREIPFDVPVAEAPTRDNVRAAVDCVVTFAITDPYRFVYGISTDDFDHVFQAVCQEALRAQVREMPSDRISDLAGGDKADLRRVVGATVAAYGVEVRTAVITFARPPLDFMRTQEERQLAVLERARQAEQQALAQLRQADAEALVRQRELARVAREQDTFQAEVLRAEAQRRLVEADAAVEALRLARLEERIQRFPRASHREWEYQRLEVARSLAGNTRAVLQVGNADQIAHALVVRDILQDATPAPAPAAPPGDDGGG